MHLVTDLPAFHPDPDLPLCLGLGNFDGVHLGHQAFLKKVVSRARGHRGVAAAFTFRDHPQKVLHPEKKPALLMPNEQKLFLLDRLGLDLCFLLPFPKDFSELEPGAFVREVLVEALAVKHVCLGPNARFGHDRKGDAALMQSLAAQYGFGFEEVEAVRVQGEAVSSSAIRDFIRKQDLLKAEAFLGRPYSLFFKVISGEGRGSQLGFPTANLEPFCDLLLPQGVYPSRLRKIEMQKKFLTLKGREEFFFNPAPWHEGVLNYGTRPTFGASSKTVAEIFLLNFKENLYGQWVEVEFYPPLRSEEKFQDAGALKKQIEQDIQNTRRFFASKKGFTKHGK